MNCMSKVWMFRYVGEGTNRKQTKYQCEEKAVKNCKHGFHTCGKHYHGCKDE